MTEIMRVNEVCEMLGVSRTTFYEWRHRGLIPPPVDLPGVRL